MRMMLYLAASSLAVALFLSALPTLACLAFATANVLLVGELADLDRPRHRCPCGRD